MTELDILGLLKEGGSVVAVVLVIVIFIRDSKSQRETFKTDSANHRDLLEKVVENHFSHCNDTLGKVVNAVDRLCSRLEK